MSPWEKDFSVISCLEVDQSDYNGLALRFSVPIINFPDYSLKSYKTCEKVHFTVHINAGQHIKGVQISQF